MYACGFSLRATAASGCAPDSPRAESNAKSNGEAKVDSPPRKIADAPPLVMAGPVNMPLPAHHAALAELNGKIYVIGGFTVPNGAEKGNPPGWEPIDNVWEYDPRGDTWRALPPLPRPERSTPSHSVGSGNKSPGQMPGAVQRSRMAPQSVAGTAVTDRTRICDSVAAAHHGVLE